MFFFRRKEWAYTPMDRPINTINIHLCDRFYELGDRGQDHDPAKNVITISPYYNDHDPVQDDTFYDFRRTCTAQILSRFPFIVEEVLEGDISVIRGRWPFRKLRFEPADALHEPYAVEFQRLGGRVCCPKKNILLALSEYDGPKIFSLMEGPILYAAMPGYCAYAAWEKPSGWDSGAIKMDKKSFAMRLICRDSSDFILIETSEEPQGYIDLVRMLCKQEGRELVLRK